MNIEHTKVWNPILTTGVIYIYLTCESGFITEKLSIPNLGSKTLLAVKMINNICSRSPCKTTNVNALVLDLSVRYSQFPFSLQIVC